MRIELTTTEAWSTRHALAREHNRVVRQYKRGTIRASEAAITLAGIDQVLDKLDKRLGRVS